MNLTLLITTGVTSLTLIVRRSVLDCPAGSVAVTTIVRLPPVSLKVCLTAAPFAERPSPNFHSTAAPQTSKTSAENEAALPVFAFRGTDSERKAGATPS